MDDKRRLAAIALLKKRGVLPVDGIEPAEDLGDPRDLVGGAPEPLDAVLPPEPEPPAVPPPAQEPAPEPVPAPLTPEELQRLEAEEMRQQALIAWQEAQIERQTAMLELIRPDHLYPWDRLDEETDLQWAAFTIYRDMPPITRSLGEAAREYVRQRAGEEEAESFTKPSAAFQRWSREHFWEVRVRAYDAFQDKIQQALWLKRRAEQREAEWGLRDRLLERVEQMLRFPLVQVTNTSEDGRVTQVFHPVKWRLADAVAFVKEAVKLGRMASNMPTSPLAVNVDELDEQIARELARLAADDQDALFAAFGESEEATGSLPDDG